MSCLQWAEAVWVVATMAFSFCQWLYFCLCAWATFLKICSQQCLDLMIPGQCGNHSSWARHQARSVLSPGSKHWWPPAVKSGIRMILVRGAGFGFLSKGKRHTIFIWQRGKWSLPGCCWNGLHVLNVSWHSLQWYKSKKSLSFQSWGLWSWTVTVQHVKN